MSINLDVAAVRPIYAAYTLDQRRLARTIVADQADDLASGQFQTDLGQRLDVAKVFGHLDGAENRRCTVSSRYRILNGFRHYGHSET